MSPTRFSIFGWLVVLACGAGAQTTNTILGAGYSLAVPINAAPGQILNLTVQGIGAGLTQRVSAPGLPLPTVLAAISVKLMQGSPSPSVPVPLLAVSPESTCPNGIPLGNVICGRYTVVTVQIPFELALPCTLANGVVCPLVLVATPAELIVSENGVAGGAIALNPVADQIHVANLCDLDVSTATGCYSTPLITHSDGSLVSIGSPAKPGEVVVIYALGLGATNPAVATGQATPVPAPVVQSTPVVNYDFRLNAPAWKGPPAPATCQVGVACPSTALFVGSTPGSVGLYQVNYVVPPTQNAVACGGAIQSNLTLTIVGTASFDGAGICVVPAGSGQ